MPIEAVNFPDTDLNQVAQVYAALIGRRLEQPPPSARSTVPIRCKTQAPLTRKECLYALDTPFRWQGVEVVPVGTASARLTPVSDAGK